ncbi:hypothetical protein GIB67_040715 [Kingdonia uniflora]|uniref:MHD2 domain-containing protein n=1 Tax=Kingdonia uniflora TaxID=39325 RepID=A0A7J7KUC3_9MAGN|nr:hypothetical protein GIB67_040715 [Kingdonia uniflora]
MFINCKILVEKSRLFPATPALTRYKDTVLPMIKKKSVEAAHIEEKVYNKLNELTVSKLCVRLNTLQYIQNQIGFLEDSIRKSWGIVGHVSERWRDKQVLGSTEEGLPHCNESIDGLLSSFNSIRKTTANAICKICDFIGSRAVFWDMKDSFLFLLYRGNVESTRLESILPQFDVVLDHICSLISDTLRDQVVLSICRATLDCYVWVLLDGGPSRMFANTDFRMMQEDLNLLKEFFEAEGDGLPPAVVEKEAKLAQEILGLYTLQTEHVIEMLMTASEQISTGSDCSTSTISGRRGVEDSQTLLRVLCHKKDREASKFLKRQYQLPPSSEYEDIPVRDSSSRSPLMTDLLKRSTSFHLAEKSQRSFRSIKKKLQAATSEIRHAAAQ